MTISVVLVAGARPNFVKVTAVLAALRARSQDFAAILVHTGQHYDKSMSEAFFADLELPAPEVQLEVGSGSHAYQTAEVIRRLEPVLLERLPDWVVVVGDVNSTLAAALVAAKLSFRVAHVEAGLRSFDRTMPEEINRVLTDQLADLLLTTEPAAADNLRREGIEERRIRFVGNVMIDTLVRFLPLAERRDTLYRFGLANGNRVDPFVLVTLHRPSNVDDADALHGVATALGEVAQRTRVLFPVHPRTRDRMRQFGFSAEFGGCELLEPVGYLDFLGLERAASVVVTDSGGVQEETTFLGVPCVTLRRNTERPVTVSLGTNRLVPDVRDLPAVTSEILLAPPVRRSPPPLWDGRAAERVADALLEPPQT